MRYCLCFPVILLLGHFRVHAQECHLVTSTWSLEDELFNGYDDTWVQWNDDVDDNHIKSSSMANGDFDSVKVASASSTSETPLTSSMNSFKSGIPAHRLSAKVSCNKAIEFLWFEVRKQDSASYSPSLVHDAFQDRGNDPDVYHARIIGLESGEKYFWRMKGQAVSSPSSSQTLGTGSSYYYSSEYSFVASEWAKHATLDLVERDSFVSAPVDHHTLLSATDSAGRYLQQNKTANATRIRFRNVVKQLTTDRPEFSVKVVNLNRTKITSAMLLYGPQGQNRLPYKVNLRRRGQGVWARILNNLAPGKYSGKLVAKSQYESKVSKAFKFELISSPSGAPSSVPSPSPSLYPSAIPSGAPSLRPTSLSFPSSVTLAQVPTGGIKYGLQDDCNQVDGSRFNICLDLRSQSGAFEPWMDAFAAARSRWEQVITSGSYPPIDLRKSEFKSTDVASALPAMVDDIYVSATVVPIDGRGGVIGMAGPRVIRQYTNPDGMQYYRPRAGVMKFDLDDVYRYSASVWQSVIVHELGHVLGVGTMMRWNNLSYREDQMLPDWYLGMNAQAEWQKLCPGGRLPVETDGGKGTAGLHWDETCLKGELMTGYRSNTMQLSSITIASLMDIGYSVDMSAADPFTRDDLGKCGAYCPDRPDPIRYLRESIRRDIKVSEEGHQKILRVAATEIQRNRLKTPQHLRDNVEYIAENYLSVFILDTDGLIKEESVTYNDVKDFILV